MFKMIGGDGREYGPTTAEELSAWVLDHRANGQTLVQPEGSTEWRPLSAFPEFAEALEQAYPGQAAAPLPPEAESGPETAGRASFAPGGTFQLGECLERGWVVLTRRFVLLAGACALVWLILTASALATCVGGLVSLVLMGALQGGLMVLYLRVMRDQPAAFGMVFSCFGALFVPLMLVAIVTQVVSQFGLLFCLLPGLVLKVLWAFALPLAADRGLSFWEAMEVSRKTVTPHFFKTAGLLLVAFLPLVVFEVYGGWRTVTFFLDVLGPTSGWTFESITAKRDEIGEFALTLSLQREMVVLLSMPFGYAALLQAYEALFGQRRAANDR